MLAAGQATPEQDDRLQKLLEGFVQTMIERFEVVARKKSYRIFEANSTVFQEIRVQEVLNESKMLKFYSTLVSTLRSTWCNLTRTGRCLTETRVQNS